MLAPLLAYFTWLRKRWVDGGYSGREFAGWVREQRTKLEVEGVSRIQKSGFQALPRRWIVERTLAWRVQHRRLAGFRGNHDFSNGLWANTPGSLAR